MVEDAETDTKIKEFLESPDLLEKIFGYIHTELVGETSNALITFLTCISAKTTEPQNLDFSGDSSTGKSKIVSTVALLFGEDAILSGAMSKTSLVHDHTTCIESGWHIVDLNEKIIVILEKENSKEFIDFMKPITGHDAPDISFKITEGTGKEHKTKNVKIRGFPALITVSTETSKKEEQSTRSWTASPIMNKEKYSAVNWDKAKRKMYPFEFKQDTEKFELVKGAIKSLRKMTVINPFGEYIHRIFPHNDPRSMRDFPRLMNLIECSAILHQNQRLRFTYEGKEFLIATIDDYLIGMELAMTMMEATFTGIPTHVKEFFEKVILPMSKDGMDITHKSMMQKYHEVYNRTIPESTLKERYIYPLKNYGKISIIDENTRPFKYEVNFNGLTDINGLSSDNVYKPSLPSEFLDKICYIIGLTESMYIGDKKITIMPTDFKETISRYIQTPIIRQSLLDSIKKRRENSLKTSSEVQPMKDDKLTEFLSKARELANDNQFNYDELLSKLGWDRDEYEEIVNLLKAKGLIYEKELDELFLT